MQISFVTAFNALDIHSWSGSGHYIPKALRDQGVELDYIGNLSQRLSPALKAELKLKYNFYKLFGKRFNRERYVRTAREYAQLVQADIKAGADVLFAAGSVPLSLVETKKPKVFYADATFAGVAGFYKEYSDLCAETERDGHYIQQKMLDSCSLAIYSSDWAAQNAIDYYKADPNKVKVVPFGANIESDRDLNGIRQIVAGRSSDECHLLFLGVDWDRKGGDLALEVAKILNDRGLKTFLHIAGIRKMPIDFLPAYAIDHGFISKNTAEGRAELEKLIIKSHFLILPTKAEAFGLVFCEANSYGVPSIATNVGGIPTIIKDDINGMKFSLSSGAVEYADYIQSTFYDKEKYTQLAYSSFNEYETRLNWKVSGKKLTDLMRSV